METIVKLTVISVKYARNPIFKIINVYGKKSNDDAIREASLSFLNEYINRDTPIRQFTNIADAERFAGLRITSADILFE